MDRAMMNNKYKMLLMKLLIKKVLNLRKTVAEMNLKH